MTIAQTILRMLDAAQDRCTAEEDEMILAYAEIIRSVMEVTE